MVKRSQPVQDHVTLRLGTTTTILAPVLNAKSVGFLYFAGHGEGGMFAGTTPVQARRSSPSVCAHSLHSLLRRRPCIARFPDPR